MTSYLRILALSVATSALLLGSAHAAQNNGGPTSTPTHTIGTKPHGAIEEVTIKEKSSTTKSGTNKEIPRCPAGFSWKGGPAGGCFKVIRTPDGLVEQSAQ